ERVAARPRSIGLGGLPWTDAVGPPPLVVLVVGDGAGPPKLAWGVEARPHARDLSRIGDDRVLEARFPWLRRGDVSVELDGRDDLALPVQDKALAVHHLEHHFMDVHRVRVGGGVVELPNLGHTDR